MFNEQLFNKTREVTMKRFFEWIKVLLVVVMLAGGMAYGLWIAFTGKSAFGPIGGLAIFVFGCILLAKIFRPRSR